MTSSAQRAANMRNGSKSKGPRSDAGKRVSAMNALKHGGYLEKYGHISATILHEDPTQIESIFEAIIHDLDPTTPVEHMQAKAIAQKLVNQERVDRLASHLGGGEELSPDFTYKVGRCRRDYLFWKALVAGTDVLRGRCDGAVQSEVLARELHRRCPESTSLTNPGPDGTVGEPASVEEWDTKLLSMVDGVFGEGDLGRSAIRALAVNAESELDHLEVTGAAIEAKGLLDQFRNLTDVQDRVQRSLARQLDAYWDLKDRRKATG